MRTALLVLLLLGGTAHADDANNDEIWIGGGVRALHAPSANALTGDSLGGSSFGYARDLTLGVVPGLALWAEAGMSVGGANGTLFQTMRTDILAESVLAGVRARYPVLHWLVATGHVDLGAQHASVELSDGDATASDGGWGAMTAAALGIELYALDRAPFGLALRVEYGYVLAQGIALTPRADRGGDTLRLPMSEFSIGSLDLSGKTFTVALLGQF